MNITIRKADERGAADFGWLDSRHTFSFGGYYDPAFMGFGPLRVINEDRVAPGEGFPTHPHADMEIISYVLEGGLEHKDSLGTGSVIRPGDVQRMTAGTGVRHSEYNASNEETVHFLQIWVIPETRGLKPSYEQRSFSAEDKRNTLRLVGSRDGRDGSITIHQDVNLYATQLEAGSSVSHTLTRGRGVWVQVVRGAVKLDAHALSAGDGAALSGDGTIVLAADSAAEVLVFDMGA